MSFYLVFESSNKLMRAKKILEEEYKLRVVPMPPQIDESCGLAIKMEQRIDPNYNKEIDLKEMYICDQKIFHKIK